MEKEKYIVAISADKNTQQVMLNAQSISQAVGSEIIAVHVNTEKVLSEAQKESLLQNLNMARDLFGEVMITNDHTDVDGLIRVAKEQGATAIFLGRSQQRPNFRNIFQKNKTTELLNVPQNINMFFIGINDVEESTFWKPNSWVQVSIPKYLIAFILVLLTSLICYPIQAHIGYQSVGLILLFLVTTLPLLKLRTGHIIGSTLLSAFIWDYFFIPPHFTLTIGRLEDTLMLMLYMIIAIVTSVFSIRHVSQEKLIRERENKTNALLNLTKDLSEARGMDQVVERSVKNIERAFSVEALILLADEDGLQKTPLTGSSIIPDNYEWVFANWAYQKCEKVGKSANTLPNSDLTYYPIVNNHNVVGVLGLKILEKEALAFDQELLLNTFIRQIAVTLENELLNNKAAKAALVSESERLYKNLFNSLSHELKTPITTILTATESIKDEAIASNRLIVSKIFDEIAIAGLRLNSLVQNLLDMARLESGMLKLKLEWNDIRDLLISIVEKSKEEMQNNKIELSFEGESKIFKFDYTLIEQTISNIIKNAAIHAPESESIKVRLVQTADLSKIYISDKGKGIPAAELGNVFKKFYRLPNSRTGGMGLGLSIAKGFVEAHKGSIAVNSGEQAGTEFVISLPMEEEAGNDQ